MPLHHAVVYGLIQGLTEFLPVSSSAHLVLLPWFTGWQDPGLAFDVALHWGTLLGVVLYFWKDIAFLIRDFASSLTHPAEIKSSLAWKIGAATTPGAAFGYVFEKQAETIFRAPLLIAATLSLLGLLLLAADRLGKKRTDAEHVAWSQALWVGLSQALAIVPGVSRSGVTITAGLFLGLDKPAAVRFSFLLSIPIVCGAGLLKIGHLIENASNPSLWVGMASSAVAGLAAIHFLLHYVRVRSFVPFVIYRFLLAAVILAFSLK